MQFSVVNDENDEICKLSNGTQLRFVDICPPPAAFAA